MKKYILIFLAVNVGAILYFGLVLNFLWSWFVVPLGVVPINIPWAIGLSVILTTVQGVPKSNEEESVYYTIVRPFVMTTFCLAVGYVAHICM